MKRFIVRDEATPELSVTLARLQREFAPTAWRLKMRQAERLIDHENGVGRLSDDDWVTLNDVIRRTVPQ